MTKRQQKIREIVNARREELREMADMELASQPVGFSACLRMPIGVFEGTLMINVTKEPDGYSWREYNPWFYGRKGRTEPKAVRLAA